MRIECRKIFALGAALLSLGLAGCQGGNTSSAPAETSVQVQQFNKIQDLDGKRIGLQAGTNMDSTVLAVLPNVQFRNYKSYSDLVDALKDGKIDAIPGDEPVMMEMCAKDDRLKMLDGYLETFDFGYAFAKTDEGQKLCDEFSEYLDEIRSNGELNKLKDKWMGADESAKVTEDYTQLPATNGSLVMVTEGDYAPFNYFKDGKLTGYDIDIAINFCKEKGYALQVNTIEFSKVLDTVSSGSADFAGAGITITEERAEQVLFSSPNYSGGVSLVILDH